MKRMLVLSLVLFGVVAFAATAGAQNLLGTLEVNGGYAKSSTEYLDDGTKLGGGITFGAAYWRPMSPSMSWGAEVSYDNHGDLDYVVPATGETGTLSTHVYRINPAIRFNFGAPVGPSFFAQGGAGLYSVSTKLEDASLGIPVDGSKSGIGFNFGAGVNFPVGPKTKLNFQGNYHVAPGAELVNLEVTDNSNYLQLRCGLGFGL